MRAWLGITVLWAAVAVATLWICVSEATSKKLEVTLGANRLLAEHRYSIAEDPFLPLEEKLPPDAEIPDETLAVDVWIVNSGLRPIGAPGSSTELEMVLPETLYIFDCLLWTDAVVRPSVDCGGTAITLTDLVLLPDEKVNLDVFVVPESPEDRRVSIWDWPSRAPRLEARGAGPVEIRFLDQLRDPDDWRLETSKWRTEQDRSRRIGRIQGDFLIWIFLVSSGVYMYLLSVRLGKNKKLSAGRLLPLGVCLLGLALLVDLVERISHRIPTVPGVVLTYLLHAVGPLALLLGLAAALHAIRFAWADGEHWYQNVGTSITAVAGVVAEVGFVVKALTTIGVLTELFA